MRITNWKLEGVFSAAVIAPCALSLAILVNANGGSQAVAQESADAVPSATLETPAKEEPATTESAKEDLANGDAAKADSANADSTKTDSANVDATKVVPADGESANGDSTRVETVSFASLNPHSLAMTSIHNRYRSEAGLSAQGVDPDLTSVAQRWADHMASVGSMYHGGGEQIIAYSGGDLSYDAGFRLWLNSSPHRAWLYSRGDRCGFGYSIGRNGCAYFAGAFGSSYTGGESYSGSYQTASSNNGRRFRIFRRRS